MGVQHNTLNAKLNACVLVVNMKCNVWGLHERVRAENNRPIDNKDNGNHEKAK